MGSSAESVIDLFSPDKWLVLGVAQRFFAQAASWQVKVVLPLLALGFGFRQIFFHPEFYDLAYQAKRNRPIQWKLH